MKQRILFCALFLFAASVTLTSCESEEEVVDDRALVTQAVAENVIIPIYHDLEEKGQALMDAIIALKGNPTSQTHLDAARNAWRAARTPFEMGEAFEYGPLEEMGIKDEVDAWPVRPQSLDSLFASSFVVNEANVRLLAVDLRGYHMIEFYLWGDTANNIPPRLGTAKDLDFLELVTKVTTDYLSELHHEWEAAGGNYVSKFKEFDDNRTVVSALEEIRYGIDHIADELGEEYLFEPFTEGPRKAESYFSDNSSNDFKDIMDGVYAVYHGDYGGVEGKGLTDFVRSQRQTLDDSVKLYINNARTAIGNFGSSFNTLAANKDPKITAAIAACEALHKLLEQQVKPLIK